MAPRRLLALMVAYILSLRITSGTQCLNGFVTKDVLIQKAASLGENRRRENQQRIIPEIKFTCSVTLDLWMFVAEDRGGGSEYPALQIWRPQNEDETQYTKVYEITNPPISTGDTNVYKYVVQPVLVVQAGDVLGIYQPSERRSRYSIIYQEGGGPINYRRDRLNASPDTFDLNVRRVKSDQSDYPLVGVQISNSTCASGFLSIDTLIAKGNVYAGEDAGDTATFDREQRLIPGISFGCDGWLNKWIVATMESSGTRRNSSPQLQIWRPSIFNSRTYTVTPMRMTSLQQPEASQRIGLNIYEYVLRPPIQFRAGDVFGLHQPEEEQSDLLLHYQEKEVGPISYKLANQDLPSSLFSTDDTNVTAERSNLPLVDVEITVDCGRLQYPPNGNVTYSSSTTSGSIATYHCHRGYTLHGMETRLCQVTNALWSGSTPTCQPLNCGPLPTIPHGKKTPTSGMTTFRSEVRFSCDEGFVLDGTATASCMDDGRWSRESPACKREAKETLCSNLPAPENGGVVITATRPGTVQGLKASYTCDSGYRLTGPEVRTCQQNGTWSGEQPACQLIECETLRPPDGGTVVITSTPRGIGIGSTANYSCNHGFYLDGEFIRECQEDSQEEAQWSVAAPVCRRIECGSLTAPEDGTITITPNGNEIGVESIATYSCSRGFELLGNPIRTCQEDGQWTNMAPLCRRIKCPSLTDPDDGTVAITPNSNEIGVGSAARYTCNTGFDLVGPPTLTCQESGQWTNVAPVCIRRSCRRLPDPENGRISTTTVGNRTASYSCDKGYKLVGNYTRICQLDGQWSGEEPTCEAIDCGISPEVEYGASSTNGSTLYSVTIYNCSTGYKLIGNSHVVCEQNESWSGKLPICEAIDCGLPPEVANGSASTNTTTLRSVATYNCSAGYRLSDNDSHLVCQANESWSGQLATCELMECVGLSPPENGNIMLTGTAVGSIASHNCKEGYMLHGDRIRTCMDNETWSGKPPLCSISQTKHNIPPPMNSSDSNLFIIIIIISVLVVIILSMCGIIIVVYIKRKRSKNTSTASTVNNHQNNSVENPLYTGVESGNESLYPWNCTSKEREAAPLELQPINRDRQKSDGAHYYDLADFFQRIPTGSSGRSRSPHYELATASGAFHSYELADDTLHYEMASNASQYEIPVSPYEIPTPQGKLHSIYGTIQWGTYVPTKEQRGLSGTSIILQSPITPADQKAFFEESDIYWKPASDSASLYEQLAKNKYREILRHQVQITEHLGSGQFGTVHKGLWQSPGGTVEVAVKTLNAGATENDKVKFLQESAINGQFQHPNVVQLHGVVTVGEPVMIVLQLLKGDLRNYLMRQRPAPGEMMSSEWPGLLLEFCQQIASGMEYLANKAFVHRDLAARNILVASDKTCKISDFGMSRDLEDENYYISNGGKIPVKWTAPEALHFKKYSTASDVWSFGIVMFEIWSLGHKPFEGLSNPEAIKMADMGFRLTPPPGCPRAVYHIMIQCWHPETASRPNFTAILRALSHSNDPADLLCWTEQDIKTHSQAAVLGAPLEAGRDLYPELQITYRDEH